MPELDELTAETSFDQLGLSRSGRRARETAQLPRSFRGISDSGMNLNDILPSLSASRAFQMAATTDNDFASRYPALETAASNGLFSALSEGLAPQLLTADFSGLVALLAANRTPTFSASGPAAQALPPLAQASGGGGGGGGQAVSSPISPTQQISGGPMVEAPAQDSGASSFSVALALLAEGEEENHAPVAVAESLSVVHDHSLPGTSVLANDSDEDGDALTAVLETGPTSAASFTFDGNGSFNYTPLALWTGTDGFTYHATDGTAESNSVVVTITVINNVPSAAGDSRGVAHGHLLSTTTVLANDDDPDGDQLTAVLESGPTHASSFTIDSSGSFSYTSLPDWIGTDSFSYRAFDGIASSPAAVVQIEVTNEGPTASPIPAVYRGAQEIAPRVVNLFPYFADVDDADDQLVYSVVQNTNAGLVTSTVVNGGDLTMNFAFDTGGIADLTIRATDRVGAYVEQTLTVYVVRVNSLAVSWHRPDGSWGSIPDNEALWLDDELSWTATFSPYSPPVIDAVEWLAKPWESRDDDLVPWQVFASTLGIGRALGTPGEGDWAVTPRVLFAGAFAMLAAPVEKVVTDFSIKWEGFVHPGDGKTNLEGDKFFPERNAPSGQPNDEVHDKISVKVTLKKVLPVGITLNVHLKAFDPDHVSGNADWDTNGDLPNDNVAAPLNELEDLGGFLASDTVTFLAGDPSKLATFSVYSRQPGNNFLVAGSAHAEALEVAVFDADGKTLLYKPGGAPVKDVYLTKQLTIWRTLHVEKDSMGVPAVGEVFTGAGGADDDVNPGNVAEPPIGLMIQNYSDAMVRVRADLSAYDVTKDAAFVRNLPDGAAFAKGASVRDVPSEAGFWVVQVFGAYEGPEDLDNDPNSIVVKSQLGFAPNLGLDGPCLIYLETIRDLRAFAATFPELGDLPSVELFTNRVVLHESLHRFGLPHADPPTIPPGPGDEGPLNRNSALASGENADLLNRITPRQSLAIQRSIMPR